MVGCHLVEQGNSCEEALALVQSLYDGMEKRRLGRSYHLKVMGQPGPGLIEKLKAGWQALNT